MPKDNLETLSQPWKVAEVRSREEVTPEAPIEEHSKQVVIQVKASDATPKEIFSTKKRIRPNFGSLLGAQPDELQQIFHVAYNQSRPNDPDSLVERAHEHMRKFYEENHPLFNLVATVFPSFYQ